MQGSWYNRARRQYQLLFLYPYLSLDRYYHIWDKSSPKKLKPLHGNGLRTFLKAAFAFNNHYETLSNADRGS